MYRGRHSSTEMSSITPSLFGGAVSTDDLKSVTSSHSPHRFATSQNPEDIVASRYLQRLGNTLVRHASPDPAARTGLSGRTASFKVRCAGSRPTSAVASSLAAVPAVQSAASSVQQQSSSQRQQQQHSRGEDGASATRRWRNQVAAPGDALMTSVAATSPPPNLSSTDLFVSSLAKESSSSAAARATLSPLSPAVPQSTKRSGKLQSSRRRVAGADGESAQNGGRSASTSATSSLQRSLSEGRYSGFIDGDANVANTTRSIARRGEGSRTPAWSISSQPSQKQLQRTQPHLAKRGVTNTFSEAALKANAAVSQAAALMSTGAPAPRKVRTEEERSAMVLAQEHAKLMLLVGRRANLEADIEDALELAEAYETPSLLAHRSTTTTGGAAPPHLVSSSGGGVLSAGEGTELNRFSRASSMADADAQLSIESGAVRRRMRQLLTSLLGNGVLGSAGGETALDCANLTRLVQQLQSQLDVIEEKLMDCFEAEEDALEELERISTTPPEENSRMRAVSTMSTVSSVTTATAAAHATGTQLASPPALTLLQRRKKAQQKKQQDLREVSSNQERMEWLIGSVDAELLTDVPAEKRTMTLAALPPLDPLAPSVLSGNSLSPVNHRSILQAGQQKHNMTSLPSKGDEGLATVLSLSPKPGNCEPSAEPDLSSSTHTRTISQPSMVPFSLSDSVSDDGVTNACSDITQGPHINDSAAYSLNLLGFMTEMLAQYDVNLDGNSSNQQQKRRPLTAPSKNTPLTSRLLPYCDSLGRPREADGVDSGGEDEINNHSDSVGSHDRRHRSGSPNSGTEGPGNLRMHGLLSPSGLLAGRCPGSGVARNSAGKRQPLLFADRTDGGDKGGGADDAFAASPSTATAGANPTLLGAQLCNLRAGLLQDLRELRTLYDYMHLIDERRRELTGITREKGEVNYETELDRKLEEHRRQQEASQRARHEAQRYKVEGVELDTFGQTGRKGGQAAGCEKEQPLQPSTFSKNITTPTKPAPLASEHASPALPEEVADSLREKVDNVTLVAAVEDENSALSPAATAEVETELVRECIASARLYFTLVGFSAPALVPAVASAAAREVKPGSSKTRRGRVSSSAVAGAVADRYFRYELRVERLDGARPSSVNANEDAAALAASDAPLIAVVKINLRHLLNLKLTPAAGVSVVSKSKACVVTVAVERGAPPQCLFTLAPVKRYKASSFSKAFEYSVRFEDQTQLSGHSSDANDGSRANSVASMPFTFPSPGDAKSRSASLDSGAVHSASKSPVTQSNTSAGGSSTSLAFVSQLRAKQVTAQKLEGARKNEPAVDSAPNSKEASVVKKVSNGPTGGKNTAARANETAGKVKSSNTPPALDPPATPHLNSKKPEGDAVAAAAPPKAMNAALPMSGGLPPIKQEKVGGEGTITSGNDSANTTFHTPSAQLPLSTTPPLQETQRPVEEWGVPHPRAAMEAVEKNAVVLTVLWAEEEELPQTLTELSPPATAGLTKPVSGDGQASGGTMTSPAAALLATIPDRDSLRGDSAAAEQIGSGTLVSGEVAVSEKEGERPLSAASAAAAAAINAVASELIRQVMEEEGKKEVEDKGAKNLLGGDEQTPSLGSQTNSEEDERIMGREECHVSPSKTSPEAQLHDQVDGTEKNMRGGERFVTNHPLTPFSRPTPDPTAAEQVKERQGKPHSATAASPPLPPTSPPPSAATMHKLEALSSRSSEPPKPMLGTKAAPSLTISSVHSRPMRAAEAHQYSGGLFHLDIVPVQTVEAISGTKFLSSNERDAAVEGATVSSPVPNQVSSPTSHANVLLKGRPPHPLSPTSANGRPSGAAPSQEHLWLATADGSTSLLPPVVVQQTGGGSGAKAHMLLPQEAVTSTLGPRVRTSLTASSEMSLPSRSSNAQERRTSVPGSRAHAATAFGSPSSPAAESSLKDQFSVLPTTGPAAEAAADVRTITHVQTFLQAVMRQPRSQGGGTVSGTGDKGTGGFAGPAREGGYAAQSNYPVGGGTGSAGAKGGMNALRSEVDELQEEARQLFMMDPVRYDAVVTELMQQATAELQREFKREQHRRSSGGASEHESVHSTNPAALRLPPVIVVSHPQQQQQRHQVALGKGSSSPAAKQVSTVNSLHISSAEEGDDAHGVSRMPPEGLCSAIPNTSKRLPLEAMQESGSTGGGSNSASVVFDASARLLSSASQQGNSLPFTVGGQGRLPSFTSPWTRGTSAGTGNVRRSTHAYAMQKDPTRSRWDTAAAAPHNSRTDPVAEVERILYEQMKAKLLLRAIIEKMQALWQTKQRGVEERNRGRAAQRMQRVVNKALAASWPIEKQRVINLRKLIYLLDRRVGRVHGWLPYYSDTNVLMTAQSSTMGNSVLVRSGTAATVTTRSGLRTLVPFSTTRCHKNEAVAGVASSSAGGDGDCADGTSDVVCPRYLRYLPQRRIFHYMRLAKSRRLMPLQLVRADIQECHSRHILLGYEKLSLEDEEERSSTRSTNSGWPRRSLPLHARLLKQRRGEFVLERYDDMKTRGERERYRRRLQGTAAFQGVSKMFSPRTRQDADLPYSLH